MGDMGTTGESVGDARLSRRQALKAGTAAGIGAAAWATDWSKPAIRSLGMTPAAATHDVSGPFITDFSDSTSINSNCSNASKQTCPGGFAGEWGSASASTGSTTLNIGGTNYSITWKLNPNVGGLACMNASVTAVITSISPALPGGFTCVISGVEWFRSSGSPPAGQFVGDTAAAVTGAGTPPYTPCNFRIRVKVTCTG